MSNKKILLFANTDWYLYNFRLSLAKGLRDRGWEVVLVSPSGRYSEELRSLGFKWLPFEFATGGVNPFVELGVIFRLIRLYRAEKPDLVHHFTIKCVIYGAIAARVSGNVPTVHSITGLGYIFTDTGVKAKTLKLLTSFFYRYILSMKNTRVIFQNSQDLDYFVSTSLVNKSQTKLIRGSGVDTNIFCSNSPGEDKSEGVVSILFASRLIKEKGIRELVKAVNMLRTRNVPVQLLIAGEIYPDNPSSLIADEVNSFKSDGIKVLGHVDEIHALMSSCDIVALPSFYREGTPKILIEAAAMEKPIVATDIAGCQGLVKDGVNGYLVPVQDVGALSASIEKLVADPELRKKMGQQGRKIVLEEFDENIVIRRTLAIYNELCPQTP